jgi:branched-chain amino acid transport system permease protein
VLVLGVLLGALWIAPSFLGEYPAQILFRLLIAVVLAEAWNLLGGYTGLVFLGTSSAVGLGGYVLVALLNHSAVPLGIVIAIAGVAGAGLAAAAAPALLRLRGLYFTVGTLALAEILRLLMINSDRLGGATGLVLDRDPPELAALVHFAALLFAVSTGAQWYCSRGPVSVLLRAVRDDEDAARQLGVRAFRVKLLVLMAASALMAAAGGIQALKLGAIEPYGMFGLRWAVDALSMAIIGGIGSRAGPAVGAAVVILSGEWLADYPEIHLALTGLLLVLIMRFAPHGLVGVGARLFGYLRRERRGHA